MKYNGEWKNNHYHGEGILNFDNGEIYCGYFEKSKRNGNGVLFFKEGYYVGEWKNDLFHGKGEFYLKGKKLKGTFKNGRYEKGILFTDN